MRPKAADLAEGACQELAKLFIDSPEDHVIIIERWTIAALEKHFPDWLPTYIDMDSETQLVPDDPRALSVLRAYSGHRVLFTASYFVAMAEKTSTKARFASFKANFVCVDLIVDSSNIAE